MADSTDGTGGGFIAPELRVERERSKLVLGELMDAVLGGKEYMEMKQEMGKDSKIAAVNFFWGGGVDAVFTSRRSTLIA